MDSSLFHVAPRIIVGIASLWCFVMAVIWYRAIKETQRTGSARRLPFPLPADIMWLDFDVDGDPAQSASTAGFTRKIGRRHQLSLQPIRKCAPHCPGCPALRESTTGSTDLRL
jgi:hypothetical protein